MASKRVSLSERRGVDALLGSDERTGTGSASELRALAKVTLYMRPMHAWALEAIQQREWVRTRRRPDKSALIQEAIEMLMERYGVAESEY